MSKKKGNQKKGAAEDDDWEAILQEEALKNASLAAVVEQTPIPTVVPTPAAVDHDDDEDSDGEGHAEEGAKKDKRKKKKPKAKKEETVIPKEDTSKISAAGKAILLRKQLLAEEEERVRKLQEAEEARVREIEMKEEAERKAIEDEKERKRLAKQKKLDEQKAAGTYMTKAEKEKAKKVEARRRELEAMGVVTKDESGKSGYVVKPLEIKVDKKHEDTPSGELAEAESQPVLESVTAAVEEEEVVDDWEADADDWESAIDKISAKVDNITITLPPNGEEEDALDTQKKVEKERLRVLGIERAKRDEETRVRQEEEMREREEMEQKEREAAFRKELSRKNRLARDEAAKAARSASYLRSPISCIMGHVDTGKTKLLDKIRHTNVQEGEAGGITQQIGATQFSKETLVSQTQSMQASAPFDINIPGLLVIDTPGHESFSNLRSRGSSLCDIAILVIDLMHGLEPQTIESINMLKRGRTPFIVALNKVDRCYGWKSTPDNPIRASLANQDENCRLEFKDRSERAILALNEIGLNAKLYWENDDLGGTVSLVPTSAVTGEGIPDLIRALITLTQERLTEKIMFSEALQCTVLEVKVIDGLGHTIDVALVNGTLRVGDTIVVSTMEGPIVTTIKALLTPPPNKEMRVKSEYIHHEVLKGAIGVKIVAQDINRVMAGTPVMVVQEGDDLEDVMEDCQSDLAKLTKSLQTDDKGVLVHASTLGALEALLQFLREECKPPIPVCHVNIGPIHKKDVMRANLMNEKGMPEFATILAFDVKLDGDAVVEMAKELNVRVFSADIIYHLFDQFSNFMNGITAAKKAEAAAVAVFPCILKIFPQHIFNKKDPIILGVEVLEGTLKLNTLLCVPSLSVDVGRVTSIENNHKEVQYAKKGASVSIRIVNESNPGMMYGRQFDHNTSLYSKLSRQSIDALKEFFKDEVSKEEWQLIIRLKKVFNID